MWIKEVDIIFGGGSKDKHGNNYVEVIVCFRSKFSTRKFTMKVGVSEG